MSSNLKDQLDFYNEFRDWYLKIIDDFNYNHKKDCKARDYLSSLLSKKNKNWTLDKILNLFIDNLLTKHKIAVYGCGPSLEKTIESILKKKGLEFFNKFINLSADGSSILLREKGIKIDAIFTDLDGISKKEFHSTNFNIVHAHGDNIKSLKSFKNEIIKFEKIIGTTQVKPSANLINSGGFTDGDRILFFIHKLLASDQKLFLIGMDFGSVIGKYSKLNLKRNQNASPEKIKKLIYAEELIRWLRSKIKNEIYFVNSDFISEDFVNLSIEEFLKL